ncbi:MAG: hypothetical protein GEV06_06455 [Luteitalea sp.]|nr:hypothetical protein [Luteitalea sp.]
MWYRTPIRGQRAHAACRSACDSCKLFITRQRKTRGGLASARHDELLRSGTRDDLVTELRDEGLRVLRDDEPLAIAHHEIRAARDEAPPVEAGGATERACDQDVPDE